MSEFVPVPYPGFMVSPFASVPFGGSNVTSFIGKRKALRTDPGIKLRRFNPPGGGGGVPPHSAVRQDTHFHHSTGTGFVYKTRKPRYKGSFAKKAYRKVRKLEKRIETKAITIGGDDSGPTWADKMTAPSTGAGVASFALSLIDQGDDFDNRVGEEVNVSNVTINFCIQGQSTCPGARLVILRVKKTDGYSVGWSDFFHYNYYLSNYLSKENQEYKFDILFDKIFDVSSQEYYQYGKIRLAVDRKITYTGDSASCTAANIQDGAIVMLFNTGDTTSSVDCLFSSRTTYTDS